MASRKKTDTMHATKEVEENEGQDWAFFERSNQGDGRLAGAHKKKKEFLCPLRLLEVNNSHLTIVSSFQTSFYQVFFFLNYILNQKIGKKNSFFDLCAQLLFYPLMLLHFSMVKTVAVSTASIHKDLTIRPVIKCSIKSTP